MSLHSPAIQDHTSALALACEHMSRLSDQRTAAVAQAKSTLEEKYSLAQLTPEAKMGIQNAMVIAMTPPQHKVRIQRTEVTVKSSKADARRQARHRRQERERMKDMVGIEEEVEIAIEDSIEAGNIGANYCEVAGQPEAQVIAVSKVLPVTVESAEPEPDVTTPPKADVPGADPESLAKHVDEVLKLTDDAEVPSMFGRELEILQMSRDPTLAICVAQDIHPGAGSASSDTEGASREDQGSETDVVDTEPELKHEVSASGGPWLDDAAMEELKRSVLSARADGLIGGKPYLYRLHHVEDRVNWENGMLRKLIKQSLPFTEQNIDEWTEISLWDAEMGH